LDEAINSIPTKNSSSVPSRSLAEKDNANSDNNQTARHTLRQMLQNRAIKLPLHYIPPSLLPSNPKRRKIMSKTQALIIL